MSKNLTIYFMEHLKLLLFAALIYALFLVWHGYEFGGNDQIEILPYALKIQDSSLYANDFHLSYLLQSPINERTVVAHLLAIGNGNLAWWTFFLHAFCGITLIIAIVKISKQFIDNEYIIYLFLLVYFVFFYKFNLGGNDVFYNQFSGSVAAKVLVAWAFYFATKNKFWFAVLMCILATFLQTIAGIQGAILVCVFLLGRAFFEHGFEGFKSIKLYFFPIAYIACTGYFLYLLFSAFNSSALTQAELYHIFELRLPHHFLPHTFHVLNYAMFSILIFSSLYLSWKSKSPFFFVILVSIIGCLVYTIGVYSSFPKLFLSTQWFKTTIWVKLFSVMMLFGALEKSRFFQTKYKYFWEMSLVFMAVIILCFTVLRFNVYQLPFVDYYSPEKDMGEFANQNLPKDALIMVQDATAFKYFSQRSEYFNYKSVVHREDGLKEWFARYENVYQKEYHKIPSPAYLEKLKSLGITHILWSLKREQYNFDGLELLKNENNLCLYKIK